MKSTNRRWQSHLKSKGPIAFFLDRLQAHALASQRQFDSNQFNFAIADREKDDELARAYFQMTEHFPYTIYIELTNHCNLDCIICARSAMDRNKGFMPMPLFEKVITEIAHKNPYAFIQLFGIGESTMDRHIVERLKKMRELGLVNSNLATNGQLLLRRDLYKKIIDQRLATLTIDYDGFSKDSYEKIRVGGNYEKLVEAVEKCHQYVQSSGAATRIILNFQMYPGINVHEMGPFTSWCEEKGYEYNFVPTHNWGGLIKAIPPSHNINGIPVVHGTERKGPCSFLWSNFLITWTGDVVTCYQDPNGSFVFGSVKQSTIEEIWTTGHQALRKQHVQGVFTGLCKGCDTATETELPSFHSTLYPIPFPTIQ